MDGMILHHQNKQKAFFFMAYRMLYKTQQIELVIFPWSLLFNMHDKPVHAKLNLMKFISKKNPPTYGIKQTFKFV